MNHVSSYTRNEGGMLILSNGDSVLISRRRKDFAFEQLKTVLTFT